MAAPRRPNVERLVRLIQFEDFTDIQIGLNARDEYIVFRVNREGVREELFRGERPPPVEQIQEWSRAGTPRIGIVDAFQAVRSRLPRRNPTEIIATIPSQSTPSNTSNAPVTGGVDPWAPVPHIPNHPPVLSELEDAMDTSDNSGNQDAPQRGNDAAFEWDGRIFRAHRKGAYSVRGGYPGGIPQAWRVHEDPVPAEVIPTASYRLMAEKRKPTSREKANKKPKLRPKRKRSDQPPVRDNLSAPLPPSPPPSPPPLRNSTVDSILPQSTQLPSLQEPEPQPDAILQEERRSALSDPQNFEDERARFQLDEEIVLSRRDTLNEGNVQDDVITLRAEEPPRSVSRSGIKIPQNVKGRKKRVKRSKKSQKSSKKGVEESKDNEDPEEVERRQKHNEEVESSLRANRANRQGYRDPPGGGGDDSEDDDPPPRRNPPHPNGHGGDPPDGDGDGDGDPDGGDDEEEDNDENDDNSTVGDLNDLMRDNAHILEDPFLALPPEDRDRIQNARERARRIPFDIMDTAIDTQMSDVDFYKEYNNKHKALKESIQELNRIRRDGNEEELADAYEKVIRLDRWFDHPTVLARKLRINRALTVTPQRQDRLRQRLEELDREMKRNTTLMADKQLEQYEKQKLRYENSIYEKTKKLIEERDRKGLNAEKVIELNQQIKDEEAVYQDFLETKYQPLKEEMVGIKQRELDQYHEKLQEFYERLIQYGTDLFHPFRANEDYIMWEKDEFEKLFKTFLQMRDALAKKRENEDQVDQKFVIEMEDKMKRFEYLKEEGQFTRDFETIRDDVILRRDLFKAFYEREKKNQRLQGFHYHFDETDQQIFNDLNTSIQTVNAETTIRDVMDYLQRTSPQNFEQAIEQLNDAFTELEQRIQQDPSAYANNLQQMFEATFNRYKSMIGNVTNEQRIVFERALAMEKESLRKIISREAYKRVGLYKAAKDDALQKFLLDPTAFKEVQPETAIPFTNAGLTVRESRRLITAMHDLMNLRQRMTAEVHKKLNLEHDDEAWKFDLVLTHLFPPSQVEMNLRYYLQLPAASRAKYKHGVFIKAIQALLPEFDPEKITREDFLSRVSEVSQASRAFLQKKSEGSGVSWGDLEDMCNSNIRTIGEIMSQLDINPESMGDDYDDSPTDPTGDGPTRDIDSGNPSEVGQLRRDQIDDAKRQNYMRMVGSMAAPSLNDAPDEPYVPLHPQAAKYFFNGENYQSLSKQYESQRPLLPKTSIKNPLRVIHTILNQYGPILGIRKPKTKPFDHPSLIQKEAIELMELKAAYSRYATTTEGEFNTSTDEAMPDAPSVPESQGPSKKASESMQTEETVERSLYPKLDPLSTGEQQSDPYTSGLRNNDTRSQFNSYLNKPWG
jgi:hypothetical protein